MGNTEASQLLGLRWDLKNGAMLSEAKQVS